MLGIVVSRADEASVHIGDRLRAVTDWTSHSDDTRPDADGGGVVYRTGGVELREFDALHIEIEGAADPFVDPDLLVFVSRHSGETGPLLTTHHTGNFGPAEFGGAADRLAAAAPGAITAVLDGFEAYAPDRYDVGLEATHHGPTDVDVPSLFVEIGSGEPQWRDQAAATAVAQTVLSLRGIEPWAERSFVGFGGGHYAPKFTRIVRETDWTVGHIAADWGLDAVNVPESGLVEQAFERSGAELAVIDGDRPELSQHLDGLGYRMVGESWLRETTGVPLALVERLEVALSPIDDGLRFGEAAHASEGSASFDIVEPAADLLADANGVDTDRSRAAVAAEAIAYETGESGNRVAGRLAVPDAGAWRRIESALVGLLRERFDTVTVEAGEIVVAERAFDPERARELGVEPGPAFGQLAAGEPVTVDGREVTPESVHVRRTRRYPR